MANTTQLSLFLSVFVLLILSFHIISAKNINGLDCISIRSIFGDTLPKFEDTVGTPSVVDILFDTKDFSTYFIEINNRTWLESGTTQFRSDGKWATLKLMKITNGTGTGVCGPTNGITLWYQDTTSNAQFVTHFEYCPTSPHQLMFGTSFVNGANNTADPTQQGDGVISSFPSFKVQIADPSMPLGYVHFGGFMSASISPQFGAWSSSGSSTLSGGIVETGPLAIFDTDLNNTIVIAPIDNHMSFNNGVNSTSTPKEFRWGLLGNISSVPAGKPYSIVLTLTRNGGGVNTAMYEWGDTELLFYGQRKRGNSHDRDYTLQYLGYSTDNGAYYYYHTEANKNYEETLIDVKKYHDTVGLPTKWCLIDSWWYYKGVNGGVKNWSARSDIFPNGIDYLYQETGWKMQAHNRYWSTDNVYQSLFNFTCSNKDCLPTEYAFWEYLFNINQDWGLIVYEQDWLSTSEDSVPRVEYDTNFGRQWLMQMGQSAYEHDLSIQYCMSFPRHVMTSVELSSVTQARASGDYHPGNNQWMIGVSSIFNAALDIAPSKDSFWSMSGAQPGPYSNTTSEPYNRLQALVQSLSNGPYTFSDQIGKSDVDLIMKCCNSDGLVLRPDVSATEIDKYFLNAAGLDKSDNKLNGEIWSTTSLVEDNEYFRYYYVLSVLNEEFKLYPSYIDYYILRDGKQGNVIKNWIVFEVNVTDSYKIVNESAPLTLSISDKYSFEYYTFIPLSSTDINGYYLQGEIGKWISVSRQRFKHILYDNNGGVYVKIYGIPNEIVSIAFVKYPEMEQSIVRCKIGETQQAEIGMPGNTCNS